MSRPVPREATVVGGGPAGSVVAILLARGRVKVRLLEAVSYPREKVCGECMSALGISTLQRHGLAEAIEVHAPLSLRQTRLVAMDGRSVTIPLPTPMWGISRSVLDTTLLDMAREAGVEIYQPARAMEVVPGDHPRVRMRDPLGEQEVTADVVLLADGKGTLPGAVFKPKPTGDLGIKGHFTNVDLPVSDITLIGLRGHYVGIAPVASEHGVLWNIACSVPADRLRELGGDREALLTSMRRDNPLLDQALANAEQVGEWKASPLPRFAPRPARDWPAGVVPVGNAAAALEPIGGEGMGLAIASAELAADTLLEGRTLESLATSYARLWRTRRAACRATAALFSRPRLGGVAVSIAAKLPLFGKVGLSLTGKHLKPAPAAVW